MVQGGSATKRILLEELVRPSLFSDYTQQYQHIMKLLEDGTIKPLKASGKNGKTPALYREYWLVEKPRDYRELEEELKYGLSPMISIDYYLSHLEAYEKDRPWVQKLSRYLEEKKDRLRRQESVNERSFEIWQREKFLSRERGKRILSHCGLEISFLNVYETAEPFAYYTHTRQEPQNLLIMENKDPFYTMRRHLLEGNDSILGVPVGTLIYGGGKRVLRSFQDFGLCAEPYMKNPGNRVYYFGDLDYEGIGIYENLAVMFRDLFPIKPFVPAYEAMLEKAEKIKSLPNTKEQQNRKNQGLFFSYFGEKQKTEMKKILEADTYIPQEILNISDF